MIELAPHHKTGLPIENPILLAAGTVGYGEAVHREMDLARFGAVTVGPITRRSVMGGEPPRLAATVGGFVLHTGLQNRGVNAVVKKFARLWPRLGCPVMAQIADTMPDDALETAHRLGQLEGPLGFELLLARSATAEGTTALVQAISRHMDPPLLVKLPTERAVELAPAAVEAGAAGVIVGRPPVGAALRPDGAWVTGDLFGPTTFASMLAALVAVKRLGLPASLVACGGVHTAEQARQALAAGADAVQLDSVVWVEPGIAGRIAGEVGD